MRRIPFAIVGALLVIASGTTNVAAHDPTEGHVIYLANTTEPSRWGVYMDTPHSPPASNTWFRNEVGPAMTTNWVTANNTRAPMVKSQHVV